jgi:hypothetical protein
MYARLKSFQFIKLNGAEVMKNTLNSKKQQSGNVLFLILIAVALFAALSYAVTQSSRSGGNSSRETNLLNSSQVTQYPTAVKTAVLRMVINGRSADSLRFDRPADFGSTPTSQLVFHPEGGGATFQQVPSEMMVDGQPGDWTMNGEFNINQIGTSAADIIAFIPGISLDVCRELNNQLGLFASASPSGTPATVATSSQMTSIMNHLAVADTRTGITATQTLASSPTTFASAFDGQSFGCFQDGGTNGQYVYYSVLVER